MATRFVTLIPSLRRALLPDTSVREVGGPTRVVTDEPGVASAAVLGFAPAGRHRRMVPVDSPSLAGDAS